MSCRKLIHLATAVAFLILSSFASGFAQDQTVGLLTYDVESSYPGFTLIFPQKTGTVFLVDNFSREVHRWELGVRPASAVYLLENGDLLRSGKTVDTSGTVGRTIQRFDWDGNLVWSYEFSGDGYRQHHDIHPMPNGNVLILGREDFTSAEAFAAGRNPALLQGDLLQPDFVVEIEPIGADSGIVVWEWHPWDHLIQDFDSTADNFGIVEEHPELIDINYVIDPSNDWTHANSLSYSPELDQIILSVRHFHEVWVVDHSTTSAEAAGHTGGNSGMGGDIIYRWGNPAAYRAGVVDDQQLFGQHDAQWIPPGYSGEGNLLVFNNGWEHPVGGFSTVDEIVTPVDGSGQYPQPQGTAHGPDRPTWTFLGDPPSSFYSATISGCQRLPNGNTLVCEGRNGRIFEVTSAGEIVWEYQNPVGASGALEQGQTFAAGALSVFRCSRYAVNYAGVIGRELSPAVPIEGYTATIYGAGHLPTEPNYGDSIVFSASIHSDQGISSALLFIDDGNGFVDYPMMDDGVHRDGAAGDSIYAAVLPPFSPGTVVNYYISVENGLAEFVSDPVYALTNQTYYRVTIDPHAACGDADGNGSGPDIADLVYVVNYMFNGGPAPVDLNATDVDGSGSGPDIADLVYLVAYMFQGGPGLLCP